jgi:hypothetical protein
MYMSRTLYRVNEDIGGFDFLHNMGDAEVDEYIQRLHNRQVAAEPTFYDHLASSIFFPQAFIQVTLLWNAQGHSTVVALQPLGNRFITLVVRLDSVCRTKVLETRLSAESVLEEVQAMSAIMDKEAENKVGMYACAIC